MPENEDLITIKIHGSEEQRQEITNRACLFMTELSERCWEDWGKTQWGWTLESSREPEL
jgi:hypothetical protein